MASRELKAELLDRMAKLLRLLASENDGEVLAAARAIVRELKSEGADIHDLANLFSYDLPSSGLGGGSGFQSERMTRNSSLVRCSECMMHADQLSTSELEFVRALEQRLSDGKPFTQSEVRKLKSFLDRVEAAGMSVTR